MNEGAWLSLTTKFQDNGLMIPTGDMNSVIWATLITPGCCFPLRAISLDNLELGRMAVRCPTPGARLEGADWRQLLKWDTCRRLNHLLFKVNQRNRALAMKFSPGYSCCFPLPTPCANFLVVFGWQCFLFLHITQNYSARNRQKTEDYMRVCTLTRGLPNPFPLLGSQNLVACLNPHLGNWTAEKKNVRELTAGWSAANHSFVHSFIHSNT